MVSASPRLSVTSRVRVHTACPPPLFSSFFFARHIVSSFLLFYVAHLAMDSSLWFKSTPPIYTKIDNSTLQTTFHIPDDHHIRILSPSQRPHQPPKGFTICFHGQLVGGLCFPIPKLFEEVSRYFHIPCSS